MSWRLGRAMTQGRAQDKDRWNGNEVREMWIRDRRGHAHEVQSNPEGWWGAESNEKDSLNSDWLRQICSQTFKKTPRCLGAYFYFYFFFPWLQTSKLRQKSALVWEIFWDTAREDMRDSDTETSGSMNNSENGLWVVPRCTCLCLWNILIFIHGISGVTQSKNSHRANTYELEQSLISDISGLL